MNLIGRSKKATSDALSMASISLSRKSSFSSATSALAFSSPSPNQMVRISEVENQLTLQTSSFQQPSSNLNTNHQNTSFSSILESSQNEKESNLRKGENFNDLILQHSSRESQTKNMNEKGFFL